MRNNQVAVAKKLKKGKKEVDSLKNAWYYT